METLDTIQVIVWVIFGACFLFGIIGFVWASLFSEKEEKEGASNSKSCLNWVIAAIIVIVVLFIMGMCTNGEWGGNWEPRHTQMQKPIKSFVKEVNFNNYFV